MRLITNILFEIRDTGMSGYDTAIVHFYTRNYMIDRYFDIEPVKCTWQGFGKPIEMYSYRRPLDACMAPITNNGFYIDRLVEPKPTEAFEKADPEDYKALNRFPAFMCISAIRKEASVM